MKLTRMFTRPPYRLWINTFLSSWFLLIYKQPARIKQFYSTCCYETVFCFDDSSSSSLLFGHVVLRRYTLQASFRLSLHAIHRCHYMPKFKLTKIESIAIIHETIAKICLSSLQHSQIDGIVCYYYVPFYRFQFPWNYAKFIKCSTYLVTWIPMSGLEGKRKDNGCILVIVTKLICSKALVLLYAWAALVAVGF